MTMTKPDKLITFLASTRVLFERLRANEKAFKAVKRIGVFLLAVCVLVAYTLILTRYAGDKAVNEYKAYLAEEQKREAAAAEEAARTDPYLIQLQEEATLGAKALDGVKLFNYDEANKKTLLQGIANRVLNKAYPGTVEGVLSQPGQFDFFHDDNDVTEENYWLCYEFFDNFHRQERLPCSPDLVFIELGSKVVLRDTLNKGYDTQTWWYGK